MSCAACTALVAKGKQCWRCRDAKPETSPGGPIRFNLAPIRVGLQAGSIPLLTVGCWLCQANGSTWEVAAVTPLPHSLGIPFARYDVTRVAGSGATTATVYHDEVEAGAYWVTSPAPTATPHNANLNLLFPQHHGYPKTPLPMAGLSHGFVCSCGAVLEYHDVTGGGPIAVPLPLWPILAPGTKLRAHHDLVIWVIDYVVAGAYHCDAAPGMVPLTTPRAIIRVTEVDDRGYRVMP